MKGQIRNYMLLVAVFALAFIGKAQTIELDYVEVKDNKVIVHYNLLDDNASREYRVNLFTSQDNFTKELTKVTGDVRTEVKAGIDKKITWDITKELGAYKGSLTFEVRGNIYVAFVKLKDFGEDRSFKRGTSQPIVWTSGNLSGQVNIELYKGNQRISGDNNQPNVGKFDWYVPSSAKKGSDYRLKFTNVKNQEVVESPTFTIKPRVPLAIKALGVAVIAGGAAALAGGGGATPSSAPVDDSGLPKALPPP